MAGHADAGKRARIRAFILSSPALTIKQVAAALQVTDATVRSESRRMVVAGLLAGPLEGDGGSYVTARGGFTLTPAGETIKDGQFVREYDAGMHQDCPPEYVAARRRSVRGEE